MTAGGCRRRARYALAIAALALPACTAGVRRAEPTPTVTTTTPVATASPRACRADHAPPDPRRPKVTLAFDLAADRGSVRGHERVEFVPDLPVTELVFRLWPNASDEARLEITKASLPLRLDSAGARPGAPGTLARLALPAPAAAGTRLVADLDFVLTLPGADVERYGHTSDVAWWASGFPLLAWERGRGWATDPGIRILGEAASSEAASYDVTVTAPASDTVVGSGAATGPADVGNGRSRWHFTNPVARDVGVISGALTLRRAVAGGVPVLLAIGPDLPDTVGDQILANVRVALERFVPLYGPFPYPSLTVVALAPIAGAGIEYPGLIFVGSRRYDVVVPHEIAHEWFYGLVGDNQARHPWLDESFATYSEALVNDASANRYLSVLTAPERVGEPMAYWDRHERRYATVVYAKGAAALLTARQEAGAGAFDAALRCYVNEIAHRIATPDEVRAAFAHLPRALRVLVEAGMLS